MSTKMKITVWLSFVAMLFGQSAWCQTEASREALERLRDPAQVAAILQKAKQGEAESQYLIAMAYLTGTNAVLSNSMALKWFQRASDKHYAPAQFQLAGMFWEGRGTQPDTLEAVHWCRKAAEQNYGPAENALAYAYLKGGRGVKRSTPRALEWYTKAAEHGNADAQYSLGAIHQGGEGVPPDCSLSVKWLTKAAQQGQRYAQARLGRMYDDGACVAKNQNEAAKLYRLAADQGVPEAQSRMGFYSLMGLGGIPQSNEESFRYYAAASEAGDVVAQFMMGQLYRDGRGTVQDYSSAYMWFRIAVTNGSQMDGTTSLKSRMSADEITFAETQAEAWLRAHRKSSEKEAR